MRPPTLSVGDEIPAIHDVHYFRNDKVEGRAFHATYRITRISAGRLSLDAVLVRSETPDKFPPEVWGARWVRRAYIPAHAVHFRLEPTRKPSVVR